MSNNNIVKKKAPPFGCIFFIIFMSLVIISIVVYSIDETVGLIILLISIIFIPFAFLSDFLFGHADRYTMPEPTRSQPEELQTSGPKFIIYSVWKNKKKVRGFLDGNTIFYKNHSTIAGSFDDRDPSNIELIYRGRVCERIIDNIVQNASDNRKLGNIHELELIPEERGEPAKLKINESKDKGEIIVTTLESEEIIGIIEGEMEKIDDIRFYAILAFVFEWFC